MGIAEVLAHVQELVDGVAGSGRCHLGRRRFADAALLVQAGQSSSDVPDLHLWQVYSGPATEERLTSGSNACRYLVVIEGYRQQRDPSQEPDAESSGTEATSELSHYATQEAIRAALRSDGATHGGSLASRAEPPQLVAWGERDACAWLLVHGVTATEQIWCHYCEIRVTVQLSLPVTLTE